MKQYKTSEDRLYTVIIGLGANGLANVRALAQHGVPVILFLSKRENEECMLPPVMVKKYWLMLVMAWQ